MSKSKVTFSLAPLVHLYKRRAQECAPPKMVNAIIEESPKVFDLPKLDIPTESNQASEVSPHVPPPPLNLKSISYFTPPPTLDFSTIPTFCEKHFTFTKHHDEMPTPNASPISPSALREYDLMRVQEMEARANALKEAHQHFHNSITPLSQRTPASYHHHSPTISLSPLCLSPKADEKDPMLPLLPLSPEDSYTGLDLLSNTPRVNSSL